MEFFSAPYVEQHHVRSACGQTTLAAKLALSSSEVVEMEEEEEEENICCKIISFELRAGRDCSWLGNIVGGGRRR